MTTPAPDASQARVVGTDVEFVATARLPTDVGEFTCHAYRDQTGIEHLALVRGHVSAAAPVLVRVHSECITGEAFGSLRCDCGQQLHGAMEAIVDAGSGVLVYLRGHEGRGIGVASKIAAYHLQDHGSDTVDANIQLGLEIDSREYGIAAQILTDLGVRQIRIMTNNPAKISGIEQHGLEVTERVAVPPQLNPDNVAYLRTKQQRMGHLLDGVDGPG